MTEKSEMLAQQARSASVKVNSGPTIELVTPRAGKDEEPSMVCLPNCQPSCPPNIFQGPCAPDCFPILIPPKPPLPS